MAHIILWSFEVAPAHRAAFARIYAADGDWARLFALGEGFLGTELLKEDGATGRYLTVDRWRTADDFAAFKAFHAEAYAALDARCEGLTASEMRIGGFISGG